MVQPLRLTSVGSTVAGGPVSSVGGVTSGRRESNRPAHSQTESHTSAIRIEPCDQTQPDCDGRSTEGRWTVRRRRRSGGRWRRVCVLAAGLFRRGGGGAGGARERGAPARRSARRGRRTTQITVSMPHASVTDCQSPRPSRISEEQKSGGKFLQCIDTVL